MDEFRPNKENKEKLSLKVLVADDSDIIRDGLTMTLKENGYAVEEVENGQLLIDKLLKKGESYDLVITDNNMPLKTGIQALREIRVNENIKNIPVIVQTGDGKTAKLEIESLGGVYLAKPFSDKNLINVVKKLTEQPKAAE